ncbi:9526_t:CDS:2, partial [Gigaspora margarita]
REAFLQIVVKNTFPSFKPREIYKISTEYYQKMKFPTTFLIAIIFAIAIAGPGPTSSQPNCEQCTIQSVEDLNLYWKSVSRCIVLTSLSADDASQLWNLEDDEKSLVNVDKDMVLTFGNEGQSLYLADHDSSNRKQKFNFTEGGDTSIQSISDTNQYVNIAKDGSLIAGTDSGKMWRI